MNSHSSRSNNAAGKTVEFAASSAAWRQMMPSKLERQHPGVVLQVLAIVELAEEISQADVRRKVGWDQPRLSKLIGQMIDADLLEVGFDYYDKRVQLLKPAAKGKEFLRFLEPGLPESSVAKLASGPKSTRN